MGVASHLISSYLASLACGHHAQDLPTDLDCPSNVQLIALSEETSSALIFDVDRGASLICWVSMEFLHAPILRTGLVLLRGTLSLRKKTMRNYV